MKKDETVRTRLPEILNVTLWSSGQSGLFIVIHVVASGWMGPQGSSGAAWFPFQRPWLLRTSTWGRKRERAVFAYFTARVNPHGCALYLRGWTVNAVAASKRHQPFTILSRSPRRDLCPRQCDRPVRSLLVIRYYVLGFSSAWKCPKGAVRCPAVHFYRKP